MNALLCLLPREENNWLGTVVFLIFVALPVVARVLKKVLVATGAMRESEPDPQARAEELRRTREAQRRQEEEGAELWRRLAGGEPQPAEARESPAPVPAARPQFEPSETEPAEIEEPSLESETEPEPLAVIGSVSEPGEAGEVSLEAETTPDPLGALTQIAAEVEPLAPRVLFFLGRGELRRAMVMSEVLGPPVALRSTK